MQFDKSDRVITSYSRTVPGTVVGKYQTDAVTTYTVKLDNGRTVSIRDNELRAATPKEEAAYIKVQEYAAETRRRMMERQKNKARHREEAQQKRDQQRHDDLLRKQAEREKQASEHQEEMRERMAEVYGRESLRGGVEHD